MLRIQKSSVALYSLLTFMMFSRPVLGASFTWNGLNTNSDLNTASNWLPNTNVPGSADDANFDSSVTNINTTPTANADFSVSTLNFLNSAQTFTFSFDNCMLTLNGAGITGGQTNTTIGSTNTNNTNLITPNLVSFVGSPGSSGAAMINVLNTGSLTGSNSGVTLNQISNDQFYASLQFTIPSGGQINVTNIASDSTVDIGGNNISSLGNYQLEFPDTLSVGNSVVITGLNQGTLSGGTSVANADVVAYIDSGQFIVGGPFQAGNFLNLNMSNEGSDSSISLGGSVTGYVVNSQLQFADSLTIGNNANIQTSNSGNFSASNSDLSSSAGVVSNYQFFIQSSFQAGDSLTFNATNEGVDHSNGQGGNLVGYVGFPQVQFNNNASFGNDAKITISNSGSVGNNELEGYVGFVQGYQLNFGGELTTGDNLNLSVNNTGIDNSTGFGNKSGNVIDNQISLSNISMVGENAQIVVSNSGMTENGIGGSTVGFISGSQISVDAPWIAGNNLSLSLTNAGSNSSLSTSNTTGYVQNNQLQLGASSTLGDHSSILVSNTGTNSGTGSGNNVGYQGSYQFVSGGPFQAGNSLNILLTNSGEDSSQGSGGNSVGYSSDTPLQINNTFVVGDNTTIYLTNSGAYTGSNSTTGNSIGYIGNPQSSCNGVFQTGDFLNFTAKNVGIDHGSGSDNSVGHVDDPQVEFNNTLIVGNHATFTITNSGLSTNSTAGNNTGFVSGEQLALNGFTAGKNLNITISNEGSSTEVSNQVGLISSNQLGSYGDFTIDDGAFISIANNGTGVVNGSQMFFQNGFDILSGSATFQVTNQGTLVGGYGIDVADGTGGDVNIILANSSLYVNSPQSSFTIGQLNGDSTSFAQVLPLLVISTDAGVNANFAGAIQNFSSPSTVVKTGPGTQTLSGINTYTGLTTVEEGTLIVNGSIAGALDVVSPGILAGTGSVVGNVVNSGIISPGQSIGTIHFLSDFTNNNGQYNVEVNGAGQSDLILVGGTATLNGGLVFVSSTDGTYEFRNKYTIVTAGSVLNSFSSAACVSPFIEPVLSYDNQHVYLTLLAAFERASATHNQLAVAQQLDSILDPTAQQNILLSMLANLSLSDVRIALDSLSGYQHTSDLITTQIINRQFIRRLYDPIRSIVTTVPNCEWSCCQDYDAWFEAGGTFIEINTNRNANGFYTNGLEVTGGIQKTFLQEWTAGVAGSYEYDNLHFRNGGGKEQYNTWFVGLYGLYRPAHYYAFVDFVYGNSSNKLDRSIDVGSLHNHVRSKPTSNQYTFYGEGGVDFNICNVLLQPFFGIEAGSYKRDRLNESNATGFGLAVRRKNHALTSTRLGIHLTKEVFIERPIDISFDVAWNARLSSTKNTIAEQFEQFGAPMEILGIDLSKYSVDYAVTATSAISEQFDGYIEASGESWNHGNVFSVLAGVEFCW